MLDAAARKGVTLHIVAFDESTHTAEEAARAVHAEVGQIVKSLVFVAERSEDAPEAVLIDTEGLLVVRYGFLTYALEARTGGLKWSHASGTPTLALLASARLDHLIIQTEIETIAVRPADGSVAWRAAHSDVITDAALVAGRLDLTTYTGQHVYLDARTGEAA